MNRFLFLTLSVLITGCTANNKGTKENPDTINESAVAGKKPMGTPYMPTGFYFIAEKGEGTPMRLERSDSVYNISPLPFASVKNITNAKLEVNHLEGGDYPELCLTFDKKGTEDLGEGTGNPLHPQIATIIANRLLFVTGNTASIKSGVMYVALVGYAKQDMKAMRDSVNHKR